MYQYYIFEIKQNHAGEYEHMVYWAWDANADTARLKGEAKYHEVLAQAAVSTYKSHAVTLFSSEGKPILNQCYKHAAPAPEPTPEPEPEPEPEVTEEPAGE